MDEAQGAQIGPCTTAADEFKAPGAKLLAVTEGDHWGSRGDPGDPGGWMGECVKNSGENSGENNGDHKTLVIRTSRNTVNIVNTVNKTK